MLFALPLFSLQISRIGPSVISTDKFVLEHIQHALVLPADMVIRVGKPWIGQLEQVHVHGQKLMWGVVSLACITFR
jgi:hypothetical protein